METTPPPRQPAVTQLDLFEHSRDVMLRNDVVEALRKRDAIGAEQLLAVLSTEFPHDRWQAPLTELAVELRTRHTRFASHDEALHALDRMESAVLPAARLVFGASEASDWLRPLWQSMARAAEQLDFDADRPRAHRAPMLLAATDWAAAEDAVEPIPSWHRIPALLGWMAEARLGRAGLESAWPFLLELAWVDSAQFGELTGRLHDTRLRTLLQRFHADPELSGEEADLAWFPAWLLISEPSLLPVFRQTMEQGHKPPERCARIVMDLLISERHGGRRINVEQRKKLKALHAGLFNRYMSTR
jgi:hypothetical protein